MNDLLKALKELETFRIKILTRKITPGTPDWIIRMCQAKVANLTKYNDRVSWMAKITAEEYARMEKKVL